MTRETPPLTVHVTKPKGKPAQLLRQRNVTVMAVEEGEGNVDRYVISSRLAVERRTGGSFMRGISDKTLFTSAIYLREHFDSAVLILEGSFDYAWTQFDPQAVRGALTALVIQYGLNVLSSPDMAETVELLLMMARQEQVGIPEISLVPKRKAVDLPDMQRRVVEMLPGCGMVTARELLQRLGSVRRVTNAEAETLRGVRGIGKATAERIVDVLRAPYRAIDTERDVEDAIEAAPHLLFEKPVRLLDRQHYIYTKSGERQFVDMVFDMPAERAAVLVELKRGRLQRAHQRQLRRYLDHAAESPLLRKLLDEGWQLRGVLASVEGDGVDSTDPDIDVRVVDREAAIDVLIGRRRRGL